MSGASPSRCTATTPNPQQRPAQDGQQQRTGDSPSAYLRSDVAIHGFWANGRDTHFDVRIVDLGQRSYRNKAPEKVLAAHETEKKDKYVHRCRCHELRKDFTPLVCSSDGIAGRETRMAEKRMAKLLAEKWQRPLYLVMPFVRQRMRIALARGTSLLVLRGSRDRNGRNAFIFSGAALSGEHIGEDW